MQIHYWARLHAGSRDSDSHLHACSASPLPTEPSSQPVKYCQGKLQSMFFFSFFFFLAVLGIESMISCMLGKCLTLSYGSIPGIPTFQPCSIGQKSILCTFLCFSIRTMLHCSLLHRTTCWYFYCSLLCWKKKNTKMLFAIWIVDLTAL